MKAKGIVTGALIGACCSAVERAALYLGFPYATILFFFLFLTLSPVSLLVFKLIHKHKLSVDLALLTGISANIAWTFLLMLEVALTQGFAFFKIVLTSFFLLMFGFVFSAITSNFAAKVAAKNS